MSKQALQPVLEKRPMIPHLRILLLVALSGDTKDRGG